MSSSRATVLLGLMTFAVVSLPSIAAENAPSPTTPARVKQPPETALHFLGRAWEHSRRGDSTSAIADFSEAILLKPRLADAYLGRGE